MDDQKAGDRLERKSIQIVKQDLNVVADGLGRNRPRNLKGTHPGALKKGWWILALEEDHLPVNVQERLRRM